MFRRPYHKSRTAQRDRIRPRQIRPPVADSLEERKGVPRHRLRLFYFAVVVCACCLTGALAYNQLFQVNEFREAELKQNFRRVLIPGPRGNIYDRNNRLLVGNRPLYSAVIYLNELRREFRDEYLSQVREARELDEQVTRHQLNTRSRLSVVQRYLDRINDILGSHYQVDSDRIERHFSQSLLLPFTLVHDLPAEDYARLIEQVALDSPIQIVADNARYYPYGPAACHVLGFVSSTPEIPEHAFPGAGLLTFRTEGKVGRAGLEKSFDDALQGLTGGEIWSVDPGGFQHERTFHRPPVKGQDLHTSLDIDLQISLERALGDRIAAAVFLRVDTGEVLAMASKPNYDLNELTPFLSFAKDAEIREQGAWLNRATQGLYPPGSTFKLVTAAAGFRQGLLSPHDRVLCQGHITVGRRVFHCHNRAGHGETDIVHAISDSCNVFFYELGQAIGIQAIADEARRFHLHEKTGIEVYGETHRMLVPDPAWKRERLNQPWYAGDTVNVSIGQGYLLVTPLQMACFAASVARAETHTRATIIRRDAATPVRHAGEPIDLAASQYGLILEGMAEAGRVGTARLAAAPNMPVAGKTGTSQVQKDGEPTTLAWFVGFSPVDDPQIAAAVMVEGVPEEETNYQGGSTAAPIAKVVFEAFFNGTGSKPAELSHY